MRKPLDAMEDTFEAVDDWNESSGYLLSSLAGIILIVGFIVAELNIGAIATKYHAPAKTSTIPCKTLDDKAGTKECRVRLDDGRIVTCIVDGDNKSCDWAHATTKKGR